MYVKRNDISQLFPMAKLYMGIQSIAGTICARGYVDRRCMLRLDSWYLIPKGQGSTLRAQDSMGWEYFTLLVVEINR